MLIKNSHLVRNEIKKNFINKGSIFFLILLFGCTLSLGFINMKSKNVDWRSSENLELEKYEKLQRENDSNISGEKNSEKIKLLNLNKSIYDEKINLLKYSLNSNIPLNIETPWSFAYKSLLILELITLFVIIKSIKTITMEYEYCTIKQLLIKPYSRYKILLSKYFSIILISIILISIQLVISLGIGYCLFSKNGQSFIKLIFIDNAVIERNVLHYTLSVYMITVFKHVVFISLAMLLAILFKKMLFPLLTLLFVWLGSGWITNYISSKYWAKFVIFPNLNLNQYLPHEDLVLTGCSLSFSIICLSFYCIIFILSAIYVFNTQDVN